MTEPIGGEWATTRTPRSWKGIYGPLDPAPLPVPQTERRTHRCDGTCPCPADGLPMFYAPSTGQHACQDPDCPRATWTCVCRYMNFGPICTHCGKLRPPATPAGR